MPDAAEKRSSAMRSRTGRLIGFAILLALFGGSLAGGYWTAGHFAPERVRAEVEKALGSVLGEVHVSSVGFRWRRGIRLEALGIELREAESVPFSLRRVELGIALRSLWERRLIIDRIVFHRIQLEATRRADGTWQPAVLNQWLSVPDSAAESQGQELDPLQTWGSRVAGWASAAGLDRVEILESALRFHLEADSEANTIALDDVEVATTPGDNGSVLQVEGRAALVGNAHPAGRIGFRATLAGIAPQAEVDLEAIELDEVSGWLGLLGERFPRAVGHLDGTIRWSPEDDAARITAELRFVEAALGPPGGAPIRLGKTDLRAVVLIAPDSIRVADFDLGFGGVAMSGHLEARLGARPPSRASLEGVLRTAPCSFKTLRDLGTRLGLGSLMASLERIRSGELRRVKLTLSATRLELLSAWVRKPATDWPPGLRIEIEAADLEVALGSADPIRGLAGRARIDRRELAVEASAELGDRPLPALNILIVGWEHLAGAFASRRLPEPVPALAGRLPLTDWIREQDHPERPTSWQTLDLELDWLDHPALFRSLEGVQATLRPRSPGIEVVLHRALWGGVPVQGEGRLVGEETSQRITLELRAGGEQLDALSETGKEPAFRARDGVHWVSGRYEAAIERLGVFSARRVSGALVAAGASFLGSGVEVDLVPRGRALGFVTLDLSQPEAVPTTLGFQVEDGDLPTLVDNLFGHGEYWEGTLVAAGQLSAQLVPGEPLERSLKGPITGHARHGEFRQRVPFALAIAAASETFNPFRSRDTLPYDGMDVELVLRGGRIDVRSFALKGPTLRLVGTGSFDTREPGTPLKAVMGVFLFRGMDAALRKVPILGNLLLGSDESLVPAYFSLSGPYDKPEAKLIPIKTLAGGPASFMVEGVPGYVKSGITNLARLFSLRRGGEDGRNLEPATIPEATP